MTEGELVKIAMVALLGLLAILTGRIAVKVSRNSRMQFNLQDLFIGQDGKASKAAVAMFIALGVSTWVIIYLTLRNRMTEGYFLAYLGWVAPLITSILTVAKGKEEVK